MSSFVASIVISFGVIFLAELGDKSQLLALNFGSRFPLRVVAFGLVIGFGLAGALAAGVGGVLGAWLPERPLQIAGGVLLIGFAGRELLHDDDEDHSDDGPTLTTRSVLVSIALTIALSEFGDKTQIATATLAANSNPLAVWIGATAGESTSAMAGALVGRSLGKRIPERALRWFSVAVFALSGMAMLVGWF